jgi:hypothetical protein
LRTFYQSHYLKKAEYFQQKFIDLLIIFSYFPKFAILFSLHLPEKIQNIDEIEILITNGIHFERDLGIYFFKSLL